MAIKAVLSNPMVAVTSPTYYTQNKGEESVDGLGWVWQCNLFAHFALVGFLICPSLPSRQLTHLVPCTRTTTVQISVEVQGGMDVLFRGLANVL